MHTSALWQVAHPYVSCAIKFTIIPFPSSTNNSCLDKNWHREGCIACWTGVVYRLHTYSPKVVWFVCFANLAKCALLETAAFSADCGIHLTFHIRTVLFMPHGVIKHCTIKKGCYWCFFGVVLFFICVHSLCDSSFGRKISNYAQFYLPKQHKKTPVWVQI